MRRIFYKKNGQIAPFMLAVIAILIMAVMVTVNIGKISLTKTHSANAADAGSLAGASVMANIFNMLADANSQMITKYEIFFATVTAWFAWAMGELIVIHLAASAAAASANAASAAACNPATACGAIALANSAATSADKAADDFGGWRSGFIGKINSIATEVTAHYLLQWNFYNEVRDAALEGHTSAVRLSFQLAFSNSGISEKLISGFPPPLPPEGDRRGDLNNYQLSFSDFVDRFRDGGIAGNPAFSRLNYPWTDGQNRAHDVAVEVTLDPPERYEVRVTVDPYLVEMANLAAIELLAYLAQGKLGAASLGYWAASTQLDMACGYTLCCPPKHKCDTCPQFFAHCGAAIGLLNSGLAMNSTAIWEIIAIYPLLALAEAGVAPRPGGDPPWKGEVTPFGFLEPDILAWIEDVGPRDEHPHNGVVRVDTTQRHAGGPDLGLWQTRYPDITSFSVSNFRRDRFGRENRGRIYEPDTHHDATITQTD